MSGVTALGNELSQLVMGCYFYVLTMCIPLLCWLARLLLREVNTRCHGSRESNYDYDCGGVLVNMALTSPKLQIISMDMLLNHFYGHTMDLVQAQFACEDNQLRTLASKFVGVEDFRPKLSLSAVDRGKTLY